VGQGGGLRDIKGLRGRVKGVLGGWGGINRHRKLRFCRSNPQTTKITTTRRISLHKEVSMLLMAKVECVGDRCK